MSNILIKMEKLFKYYGSGKTKFCALNDVSLEIRQGEFIMISGRSGSGKSTLLNVMSLIDNYDSGKLFIYNKDVSELNNKKILGIRRDIFGFIYQNFYLEPSYNVFQNVEIPLLIKNIPSKERKKIVLESLEKVGLEDKMNNKANELSGGEMQRVSVARAIAKNPQVIFADEPCGNLDIYNSNEIMKILNNISEEGKTIVLVTHNKEDEKYADRIINIEDGKIL